MDNIDAPVGRREKRKQEIRARIEGAAYALFRDQGIEDTSIEQICEQADVARRTFYAHYANKHALLGGLGISRLYGRSEAMVRELLQHHHTTRDRLEAMIDYIETSFAGFEDIDRQLILVAPVAIAHTGEQRKLGDSAVVSFSRLFTEGLALGDVSEEYTPEILATMIVGTLNTLTSRWAEDDGYPIFAKLEEARRLFEQVSLKT